MYLHLSDFDHLRDDPTVRFREETVNGVPVIIIAYMISNEDLWHKANGLETRGPCFHAETGELLSLPFDKFFNVNEKEWTQAHRIQDEPVLAVLDKMDGSMITPARVGGSIFLKTKKSFYSDVAVAANMDLDDYPNVRRLCGHLLKRLLCPIFEYTTPDNKVVLDYGDGPRFTLIAIRDMIDGTYCSHGTIRSFAEEFDVPVVKRIDFGATVQGCLNQVETAEGIEGWCIYTDKAIYKVKTRWYIDRHHLIDIRERDIAELVLADKLDDMMPNLLAAEADLTAVRRIEHDIVRDLAKLMHDIDAIGGEAAAIPIGKERADFVAAHAGELAKFVHRRARDLENSDESLRDFYRQRYLSTFSLRSIGNPNFRSEADE